MATDNVNAATSFNLPLNRLTICCLLNMWWFKQANWADNAYRLQLS